MSKARGGSHYAERWSYEALARKVLLDRLGKDIEGAHLWIVHASRWLNNIYAGYDNFLRCDQTGTPDFSGLHGISGGASCCGGPFPKAWIHLSALIDRAVNRVEGASSRLPCAIIGFSKGASVVTQLFYELAVCDSGSNLPSLPLMEQVRSMSWLDSGHNGQTHLWPTWEYALSRLSHSHPRRLPLLFVFGTPYEVTIFVYSLSGFLAYLIPLFFQLCDKSRPWNRRDFKTFINLLTSLNIPHVSDTFFRGEHWDYTSCDCELVSAESPQNIDLESHFEILSTFPLRMCLAPCLEANFMT